MEAESIFKDRLGTVINAALSTILTKIKVLQSSISRLNKRLNNEKTDKETVTFTEMDFITARIRYIYLDVVEFTRDRTVEAQVYIISALNDIVKGSLATLFPELDVIYIPIGDGTCICLLESEIYDDYIIIAEEIIHRINAIHNPSAKKDQQFQVRIGVNENVDNIINDINGNRNVCGSGVNDAQRIMSFGDANHILVGRSVADSLLPREKYLKAFHRYVGKTKHSTPMEVFQYVGGEILALNRSPPAAFAPPPEKPLTEYAAYYIATLLRNHEFIENKIIEDPSLTHTLAVQMSYLAEDALGHAKETKFHPYHNHMPKTPNNTLQEQFALLYEFPSAFRTDLHQAKVFHTMSDYYSNCFEPDPAGAFIIPSKQGERKLKNEWPLIYKQFNKQS